MAQDSNTPLTCECTTDGYCPRYQKEMRGRSREICQGVNVDLGTAAAFRGIWLHEAPRVLSKGVPKHLLLKTNQAPGDAVAMTAAIYSLHKAHPGRYLTSVESSYPEVFAHNPDVVPTTPSALPLQMHYPAIHQSNSRSIHFIQGWCEFLGTALGVSVPLLTNRPHLYLSEEEDRGAYRNYDYWLVCSGGKSDFTNKLWGRHNYQEVVSRLGNIHFVQVGHANDDHPQLDDVEDMVGKTSLTSLFHLVNRARGVLCGVSLLMHVAAALEKPAIVIAGGREPVAWNAYPKQQYVHTVGALPCTSSQGESGGACWRSRVVPLGDTPLDQDTCQLPVNGTPTSLSPCIIPSCMNLITPTHVVDLILRYNQKVSNGPTVVQGR